MELFEEFRRQHEFPLGSVAGVVRKFGVHRRLVREALSDAVPREACKERNGRAQINAFPHRRAEVAAALIRLDRSCNWTSG